MRLHSCRGFGALLLCQALHPRDVAASDGGVKGQCFGLGSAYRQGSVGALIILAPVAEGECQPSFLRPGPPCTRLLTFRRRVYRRFPKSHSSQLKPSYVDVGHSFFDDGPSADCRCTHRSSSHSVFRSEVSHEPPRNVEIESTRVGKKTYSMSHRGSRAGRR